MVFIERDKMFNDFQFFKNTREIHKSCVCVCVCVCVCIHILEICLKLITAMRTNTLANFCILNY